MALAGEFMVEVTPPNGGNTVSATTTSGGTISGIMPTGQLFTINVYTNGLSSTPGPLTCYANGSQIFSSTSEEEGINSQDQFTWQTSTAGTYNIYCKFTAYEVNLTTQNIVVTVGPPASTPVFSPAAGTYTSPQTVAISDATSGATIYYTTNGSLPTTNSTKYTGPIAVGYTETLEAIAVASSYSNSATATAKYTINLPTPSLSVATSGSPSFYGNAVTFTASISSGPTGAVTFYDSGTGIGTSTISGTTATYTTSTLVTGTHTITVGWAGNSYYKPVTSAAITQTVSKATPTITWATPAAITYGTALSGTQLNASTSPSGTFVYTPASGTVLGAGSQTLSVTFTPTDTTDYNSATKTVALSVSKATPTITWSTPAAITYGTALSGTQLNAATSPSGAFVYTPASGTVLGAGSQTLSVTFTPTDITDYNSATATVGLSVSKATPTITWSTPAAITYGSALSGTQLNASTSPSGAFVYTPASGTVLGAGSQTLSVTFTPTDTTDYNSATATVGLSVSKATPTITWSTPAAITYGTTLSTTQLNATANVPGAFLYTPTTGTVMAEGTQTLSVTFTPTDTTDYNNATATVALTVSMSSSAGIITTVAGNGIMNYSGDGGAAISAELSEPRGIIVDSTGNLYIADDYTYRVRKVSASTGVITTVAGNGTWTYTTDGVAATSAGIVPGNLAMDSAGNLYIADGRNCRVYKVNSSGIIATVAGSGVCTYAGDGGAATSAGIDPGGIAIDPAGNLYIADVNNNRLRKVANGIITTVAGDGALNESGDGGQATNAEIAFPSGVAVDTSGNIYISDVAYSVVREITASTSIITTVAGGGTFSGDGILATEAALDAPAGISLDSSGNIYINDGDNSRVRKVMANSGIIMTIDGDGSEGYSGDGGPAIDAELYSLGGGVAVDPAHNVYIADSYNSRVRVVGATETVPALEWATPAPITYGTALSATQLNATSGGIPGTFIYSPALNAALAAGFQTLSVTFTPTDSTDYTTTTASVLLTVNKATPTLTWATPAAIADNTALGAAQLNAASSIPGTFNYDPAAGTVLVAGSHVLSATLTPTDAADYNTSTSTVTLSVLAGGTPDTGTATLIVNGVTAAAATYGAGATTSTVAAGLAAGVKPGSPVTITAVDDSIYIEAKPTTSNSNYAYSLNIASNDPTDFSPPSFQATPSNGNLDGGAVAGASGQTVYSFIGVYDEVGNLLGYSDSVMGASGFNYDTLNRLVSGATTPPGGPVTNYCWAYDPFGNRTTQSLQVQPCPAQGASVFAYDANNHVSGVIPPGGTQPSPSPLAYDPAGNVTVDLRTSTQYLYDGEGRICAVASDSSGPMTGYIYDASGARVAKGRITTWSCDPALSGFTATKDYVLGPSGEQVTEMAMDANTTMAWQHTNVWAGGTLLATYDNDGVHFYLNDPLGTRRAQTDYAGVLEQTCSSLPFGDQLSCTGSLTAPTENHFTGKERDSESGNDYFGARYYASSMGRWLSPDWSAKASPVPYAVLTNPQTLNLYAYTTNNPLIHIDHDGHAIYVSGDATNRYLADLQKASGLTLGTDKNGKISITASPDKLSAVGQQISKIIGDKKNFVFINALSDASGVLGGHFLGNGSQTLSYKSIDALSTKGGFTSASIITHETTEAYQGLLNGNNFMAAHATAISYENSERANEGLGPRIDENPQSINGGNGVRDTFNFSFGREVVDFDRRTGSITNVTFQKTNQPETIK
jgi:RHS repeat-associated protein